MQGQGAEVNPSTDHRRSCNTPVGIHTEPETARIMYSELGWQMRAARFPLHTSYPTQSQHARVGISVLQAFGVLP